MMIEGVMLLWFGLTALAVAYVAVDIRSTPEHPVMKVGFVVITLFSGPFGAFLYVFGCREPLPGLHERYAAVRWRQVLGSTMHCVAGDGIGILVGAVIGALVALPTVVDMGLEYVLGFGFGWTIFQALFMRSMVGSYGASLKSTFIPEFLSMNCLMGGMLPVMAIAFSGDSAAHDPAAPLFWFRMSLALMFGFVVAFPMNWWLVANHLKHGMMTVRRPDGVQVHTDQDNGNARPTHDRGTMAMGSGDATGGHAGHGSDAQAPSIGTMTLISLVVLVVGVAIALTFGGG